MPNLMCRFGFGQVSIPPDVHIAGHECLWTCAVPGYTFPFSTRSGSIRARTKGSKMTLEDDRAEIERVAVSWQDVSAPEQEEMLASLGRMLDYLGFDDAEYQLRLDAKRLMEKIQSGLTRPAAV